MALDNAKKDALIENLANGLTIAEACRRSGVRSRDTFYSWLVKDKEFAERLEIAKRSRIEIVEDALFKKAKEGHPTAMIFFLTNRDPKRWQDRRSLINNTLLNREVENQEIRIISYADAKEAVRNGQIEVKANGE